MPPKKRPAKVTVDEPNDKPAPRSVKGSKTPKGPGSVGSIKSPKRGAATPTPKGGSPKSPKKGKRASSAKKGKGGTSLGAPHEEAPVVTIDMSTIKPSPLEHAILHELDSTTDAHETRRSFTPHGKEVVWLEHAHRTPVMMERNMPCVPHVNHHTLSRCWFNLRTKFEPVPLPVDPLEVDHELAHPPQTMLHYLIDNGEDMVQGSPNLANWNALQQLIRSVYPKLPSGMFYYRLKPSLPSLARGLHAACANGNAEKANDILRMNTDYANYPTKTGDFPLLCAAQGGHLAVAYLLLQNGAISDAPDASGNTALHYAASGGHLRLVELLLDCHAHVDCENAYGETPLHFACRAVHPGVVRLLLDKHAHTDTHTRGGYTPLHYAAAARVGESAEMSRMLLEAGAAHQAMTQFGHTPLERAARAGCHDAVAVLANWHPTEAGAHHKAKGKGKGAPKKGAKK